MTDKLNLSYTRYGNKLTMKKIIEDAFKLSSELLEIIDKGTPKITISNKIFFYIELNTELEELNWDQPNAYTVCRHNIVRINVKGLSSDGFGTVFSKTFLRQILKERNPDKDLFLNFVDYNYQTANYHPNGKKQGSFGICEIILDKKKLSAKRFLRCRNAMTKEEWLNLCFKYGICYDFNSYIREE